MKWISNKTLFNLHGWLGLNLGLLLFVICFSGTFATLSSEADWLLNSDMRVQKSDQPIQWQAMYSSLKKNFPEGTVLGIYKNNYAVRSDNFATVAYVGLPTGQTRKIYLNPYSGEIQGHTSFFDVQRFFRTYHRRFFDGKRGILVITFTSFFLLFSVLTGFLFYKGWLKNLFKLRLKNGIKALWSDAHKLTGIWSLLFALLVAVTGIFYFAEELIQSNGYGDVLVPDDPPKIQQADLAAFGPNPQLLPLDAYVANAQKAFPELNIQSLKVPHQPDGYVYIDGQADNPIVRDRANRVYLHPFTGQVVHIQKSSDLNTAEFITNIADPLHFGYFGGLPIKILWFIFGLGISFAILSGTYLWYVRGMKKMERKLNRKRNGQKKIEEDNEEKLITYYAGFCIRYLTISRGAVFSTALILLYLISTGMGVVKDEIRSFGPLPVERFTEIENVQLGPWTMNLMCEYPCTFQDGSYFVQLDGAGIPNYTSLTMEIITTGRGDTIRLPFKGNAIRPSLTGSHQIDESAIQSVKLKAKSRGGQIFEQSISDSGIKQAQQLLSTSFDLYPERKYPAVPAGVYVYISLFALCTLIVLGCWTYFLIRTTSKKLSCLS